MTTTSLCIINMNDRDNLVRLITAARAHVDEIIVVDTGSTDGSMEAARLARADVVDNARDMIDPETGFVRSFSEARQRSFDLASGDWLMWLDTDDDLNNWERLRPLVAELDEARRSLGPLSGHMWYDYSWTPDRARCTQSFRRERLVHRDDGPRWTRPVHEYLRTATLTKRQDIDSVRVIHLSQGARGIDNDRNLRILQRWAREGGELTDPLALHYYLGDEFLARRLHAQAFEHFSSCPWNPRDTMSARAVFRGLVCLYHSGRLDEAHEWLQTFIERCPFSHMFHLGALVLLQEDRVDEAREALRIGDALPPMPGENPLLKDAAHGALAARAVRPR